MKPNAGISNGEARRTRTKQEADGEVLSSQVVITSDVHLKKTCNRILKFDY